jgi:hypothetical protein
VEAGNRLGILFSVFIYYLKAQYYIYKSKNVMLIYVVRVGGMRLCLWTAATNGLIVHPIWVCRYRVGWHWQGKPKESDKNLSHMEWPGWEPGPANARQATNRLSHGMANTDLKSLALHQNSRYRFQKGDLFSISMFILINIKTQVVTICTSCFNNHQIWHLPTKMYSSISYDSQYKHRLFNSTALINWCL